ncbi:MarR family winged helix-turn-helix transcriptional regulator [Planosporangium sp. 12N6]|uniref:MarR family winged helix-turn-helix transcriptional regulator n=1 Tax=Planosporangium spinosum TaxID=3402278 RepID=UPI003CEFB466
MNVHQSFTGVRPVGVEQVREQWAAVRPDLPTDHLPLVVALQRVAAGVRAEAESLIAAGGLNRGEFDLLCVLRRLGPGGVTPAELTASTLVSAAGTTKRLAALEEHGWITRTAAPRDRRKVLIRLTPDGRQRLDALLPQVFQAERQALSRLSADEQSGLTALLSRITP